MEEDKSLVEREKRKPGSNQKRHNPDKLVHQKRSSVKRRREDLIEEDLDDQMHEFDHLIK